jgi:hypothetical protein
MAQIIQTLFIDDIDGSEAEGTVRFELDGAEYEIDLNAEHARALRETIDRYRLAARKQKTNGQHHRRPARSRPNGTRPTVSAARPVILTPPPPSKPAGLEDQAPSDGAPVESSAASAPATPNTADVRQWAKAQGLEVKDRGRVPADLVVKFRAATGK